MSEIDVRMATPNDAETIAAHRAGMFLDMGSLAEEDAEPLRRATAEVLRGIIGRDYFAWLARAGDRVVAGCGLLLRPVLPRPGRDGAIVTVEGIILNVYVDRDWRRRGIAERLMRECLDWARGRGLERIVLHASPEGRHLYEKLGFRATNEMRLHSV